MLDFSKKKQIFQLAAKLSWMSVVAFFVYCPVFILFANSLRSVPITNASLLSIILFFIYLPVIFMALTGLIGGFIGFCSIPTYGLSKILIGSFVGTLFWISLISLISFIVYICHCMPHPG